MNLFSAHIPSYGLGWKVDFGHKMTTAQYSFVKSL